jgi:hypothetical protein
MTDRIPIDVLKIITEYAPVMKFLPWIKNIKPDTIGGEINAYKYENIILKFRGH